MTTNDLASLIAKAEAGDWTGADLTAVREALELGAATALGQMLIEFSRLDLNLGLFLVAASPASDLVKRTEKIEAMTLEQRLTAIRRRVAKTWPRDTEAAQAFRHWLVAVHKVRQQRNQLVHGRWGVDPMAGKAVNVWGLPTSREQRSRAYTLDELHGLVATLQRLQGDLHDLSRRWPLSPK